MEKLDNNLTKGKRNIIIIKEKEKRANKNNNSALAPTKRSLLGHKTSLVKVKLDLGSALGRKRETHGLKEGTWRTHEEPAAAVTRGGNKKQLARTQNKCSKAGK